MRAKFLVLLVLGALLCACMTESAKRRAERPYILTGAAGRLFVVDPAADKVVADFAIPGANHYLTTIVPSPTGTIAYVLINHAESISGIDLRTGREVFRADLSSPGERVKCMNAFDVTADGTELIVYEYPTRLGLNEYTVEPPRFAVFSTAGGLHAEPVRTFPAPRRVLMVLARRRGSAFFALGFNLHEFDQRSGHLLGKRGILDWNRPNHVNPDFLSFWPVSEPTGIFSNPVYSTLIGPGTPSSGVPETSLMTLNLRSGRLEYHDLGPTNAMILTTVLAPDGRTAFGAFKQLVKIDTRKWVIVKQVNLPHTYYTIGLSPDGREVYVGGAMCDVAIYDASTLSRKSDIRLPGCADQGEADLRVIERP